MRCTNTDRIRPVVSLREFFRDSVAQSMQRQGVRADDNTAHYVVSLLTLFARSEALFEEVDSGVGLKPLALMLADAVDAAGPEERAFSLQRLGDVSLFVAGFFADGLACKSVDVDYYIGMGGGAYHSLSQQLQNTPRGSTFGPVFDELACKFKAFVDVLNDIRSEAQPKQEQDILRLYELWLRTGSARAARSLRSLGIEPNSSLDRRSRH